jgi:1-acyl-sn-glycerol-3-phosphate acyltransferase
MNATRQLERSSPSRSTSSPVLPEVYCRSARSPPRARRRSPPGSDASVTGRAKDLIIRAGRNIHPQELEEAVGVVPGIRLGFVAVFGTHNARSAPSAWSSQPRRALRTPRTSRNSSQRSATLRANCSSPRPTMSYSSFRAAFQGRRAERCGAARVGHCTRRESFVVSAAPPDSRWRGSRSPASALDSPARRAPRGASSMLPGRGEPCSLSGFRSGSRLPPSPTSPFAAPSSSFRPSLAPSHRHPCVRRGLSNIPAERPSVLVPNHASYLDSFVLVAVLPPRFIFLAKKEFDRNVVPSVFLRRLGTLFAERTDAEQGVQDAAAATDAVRAGQGLVVFPEGTFHRASGLRPFKLGAFLVAAQAGVPLLPVTIRGMRSILRDGQKVPRPGRASISIGAPIIHRTLQSRPMVCHCKLGIKSRTDLLTFHKTPAKPRESHLGEVIGSYWNGQSRANLSLPLEHFAVSPEAVLQKSAALIVLIL